jgi:FMN phosphatase YigB (HAD superfamily)
VRRPGLEPEEIIFADDNPSNLAGAEKVGITTFLYKDFDSYARKLRDLGVEI